MPQNLNSKISPQQAVEAVETTVRPGAPTGKHTRDLPAAGASALASSPRQPIPRVSGGTAQRRSDDALASERWLDAAMRPDRRGVVQRQAASENAQAGAKDGPAQALPDHVRGKMESSLGADFSAVRVHEGPESAAIGAQAFTQGTDVHFAPGRYQPESASGQELIGHELAHVVQQSQGRVATTTQAKGVAINDDPALESEADEMGARAARGEAREQALDQGGVTATATVQAKAPVQRYTLEQNYTLGVTMPNELMFQKQAVDHGTGTHVRVNKYVMAGSLVAVKEEYDPTTQAWNQVETELLPARPELQVSANGRIAKEPGQSKVLYVDPAMLGTLNDKLENAGAPVRLQRGTATITLPAGMAGLAAPLTLVQVSAVRTADLDHGGVDRLEDMQLENVQLQVECHNIAQQLGKNQGLGGEHRDHGAGADANATPEEGQKYYYHSPANAAMDTQMPLERPGKVRRFFGAEDPQLTFRGVLEELRAIDLRLARIGENYSQIEAMGALGGLSDEAKAILPGWGDHSETVVAKDGADTVTMVNYNRATEANWIVGRVLRETYRDFKAFRTFFQEKLAEVPNTDGRIDAVVLAHMTSPQGNLLQPIRNRIAELNPEGGATIDRARASATQLGQSEWYFDMYGGLGQSFHEQYQILASRGLGNGTTVVAGEASEANDMLGDAMIGLMNEAD